MLNYIMQEQKNDREKATQWARALLKRTDWVILDTETTGLSEQDEIVQIAILGSDGSVLLDTFIKPTQPVSAGATAIHGITSIELEGAPRFPEVIERIKALLHDKTIVIYNAPFDLRLLQQTLAKYELPPIEIDEEQVECAMLQYSAWKGEIWTDGSYKWQRLVGGDHTALGDCRATLDVIRKMAY